MANLKKKYYFLAPMCIPTRDLGLIKAKKILNG